MVDYEKRYLNLVQDDCKTHWWKLFKYAVDSNKWTNVLKVVELLFTLPVSNGHLEKVFSQMIQTNNRTSLQRDYPGSIDLYQCRWISAARMGA